MTCPLCLQLYYTCFAKTRQLRSKRFLGWQREIWRHFFWAKIAWWNLSVCQRLLNWRLNHGSQIRTTTIIAGTSHVTLLSLRCGRHFYKMWCGMATRWRHFEWWLWNSERRWAIPLTTGHMDTIMEGGGRKYVYGAKTGWQTNLMLSVEICLINYPRFLPSKKATCRKCRTDCYLLPHSTMTLTMLSLCSINQYWEGGEWWSMELSSMLWTLCSIAMLSCYFRLLRLVY